MDIVVKGRNVEVPEHYRAHVNEKLSRLERYGRKVIRYDVELFHEPNRRQVKNCQRLEITVERKGSRLRAEASAGDFYAALDIALNKLENRLRKVHDRRRVHHGRRSPVSVAEVTGRAAASNGFVVNSSGFSTGTALLEATESPDSPYEQRLNSQDGSVPQPRMEDDMAYGPGRIVREKQHSSNPMTVDEALSAMELVGHDFYLFQDAEAKLPSVVYRRKGFDYGVIRLA